MKFWQKLRHLLLGCLKIIGAIGVWFVLAIALHQPILWLNTEHYAPHDTPNAQFRVLIIGEQGEYPAKWQDAQNANWVRQADSSCHSENCLVALKDGSLKYRNEGALWFSVSRYRIIGNQIEPISFATYTFFDVFVQMILAAILYTIGKYALMRWWLRGSSDELRMYH